MNETHPCPICGEDVAHWDRYPRQVCRRCENKASDAYGRRLQFYNAEGMGGFYAVYRDNGARYENNLCWIDGVRCSAGEHRFGGIVVEVAATTAGG